MPSRYACRPRGQRWVLYGLEPVSYSGRNVRSVSALFDVTSSYSPHSHVPVQYGRSVPLSPPSTLPLERSTGSAPTVFKERRAPSAAEARGGEEEVAAASSSSTSSARAGGVERFVDVRSKRKLAYAVISRCSSWFDRLGFIRELRTAVGEDQVRAPRGPCGIVLVLCVRQTPLTVMLL